jgi:putrescine aminotransferase
MAGRRRGPLPAPLHRLPGPGRKGARVITRADNIYLWDSEGHKILDAMSGLWCVNVGYGQQALVDAATRQMQELPFYNAFFQTATPPAIELAELLAEVSPPQFQHVFFSGSGSARATTPWCAWCAATGTSWASRSAGHHQPHNAYHGSTMAGASLGGMSGMHAQGGLPIPASCTSSSPTGGSTGPGPVAATTSACWPRAGWKTRSWRSAPTPWPPSSASRCRAPAA